MICLSIRQPWAWLIVNGYKDVENRTWLSKYIGELYIHASKNYDPQAIEKDFMNIIKDTINDCIAFQKFQKAPQIEDGILLGGIVGKVQMVDCVTEHDSPWFTGPYGFVFKDPEPLPFSKLKGSLKMFHPKFDHLYNIYDNHSVEDYF